MCVDLYRWVAERLQNEIADISDVLIRKTVDPERSGAERWHEDRILTGLPLDAGQDGRHKVTGVGAAGCRVVRQGGVGVDALSLRLMA